jgi:hypothetical protein
MSYQSQTEIENIVRGFEECETGADDFKHAEHLVVAVWYVESLGREAALDRMRSALMRFLDHHGVDKKVYSETVTAFWIDRVAKKLRELGPDMSLVERSNQIVESQDFKTRIFADEHGSGR